MGFWDTLLGRPQPTAIFAPNVTHLGAGEDGLLLGNLTPAQMFNTQPHLRTVVSFLARNIAQCGLHCFELDGDDRKRDRTSPFALAMQRPNGTQTAYDLVYSLVGDHSLYERAYWLILNDGARFSFVRIPPSWVTPKWKNAFELGYYIVQRPDGDTVRVEAADMLDFTGYSPTSPRQGSPTVEALKATLEEQLEAAKYRSQVWKRGGRVSSILERPKDAPEWSDAARESFREDWYAKYTGNGSKAGGTPILEDGMTLKRIDFNAQEQQYVEAAKLSFATVAAAFHVNPTMVGQLDNANYSNVREFRRSLYGDTLGPLIAQIEARINTFLLPRLGMDPSRYYVEFNIGEKLQGSFEEQAAVLSTSIGAPWMSRNEGRGRMNLPKIDGGDELVTPLNVLIGGQASPQDGQTAGGGGSQDDLEAAKSSRRSKSQPVRHKAADLEADEYAAEAARVLTDFFDRQSKRVLSALGSKAGPSWWDEARWNDELADDLYAFAFSAATAMGRKQAEALGFRPDDYDAKRTVNFLRSVAKRRAEMVNQTTLKRVEEAIESDADPADVFTEAKQTRSDSGATALVTSLAGFALTEASKQTVGDGVQKQWVVTSSNPRSEHAAMDGEVVGIDDTFSNGANWPGDPVLGAEGVSNCRCSVDVLVP